MLSCPEIGLYRVTWSSNDDVYSQRGKSGAIDELSLPALFKLQAILRILCTLSWSSSALRERHCASAYTLFKDVELMFAQRRISLVFYRLTKPFPSTSLLDPIFLSTGIIKGNILHRRMSSRPSKGSTAPSPVAGGSYCLSCGRLMPSAKGMSPPPYFSLFLRLTCK
jgi:hypothetical protein